MRPCTDIDPGQPCLLHLHFGGMQVRDALAAAELLRGELERRGVFVVAAPIFGGWDHQHGQGGGWGAAKGYAVGTGCRPVSIVT